jgi:hypothetical protein
MGMTKHYRDLTGNCLGGFDGAEPPIGSIECPAPNHGLDKWANGVWVDYVAPYQQLRAAEYNLKSTGEQFGMMFDDAVNSTTTWVDWQQGIKTRIPKT